MNTNSIATFKTRQLITIKVPGRTRATRIQFYSGTCTNCGLTLRQESNGEFPAWHLGTGDIECAKPLSN